MTAVSEAGSSSSTRTFPVLPTSASEDDRKSIVVSTDVDGTTGQPALTSSMLTTAAIASDSSRTVDVIDSSFRHERADPGPPHRHAWRRGRLRMLDFGTF